MVGVTSNGMSWNWLRSFMILEALTSNHKTLSVPQGWTKERFSHESERVDYSFQERGNGLCQMLLRRDGNGGGGHEVNHEDHSLLIKNELMGTESQGELMKNPGVG